jgi:hypothetical protein
VPRNSHKYLVFIDDLLIEYITIDWYDNSQLFGAGYFFGVNMNDDEQDEALELSVTEDPAVTVDEEERERANQALGELIDVLAKYKLRAQDLVVVYGNLGYAIGASMEGHSGDSGPGVEELQQAYYSKPTLGVALMLQGMLITSWHADAANQTNEQG